MSAGPACSGSADRQAAVGLALATGVVGAWLAVHVLTVYRLPLAGPDLVLVPVIVVLQCWLSVGLFIVAHDAMHGSLAPRRARLNRAVGRVALLLYGGIWYDDLVARHFAHHRLPGTAEDPDFAGDGTVGLWRWYGRFFRQYLSWGQVLRMGILADVEIWLLHAPPLNLVLFWAVPALLSSLQLFYFGTYLPHRLDDEPFTDRHRTRSNAYSYLVSLATCFHFGYHHEHHDDPSVPWWRLPAVRREAGRAHGWRRA